MATVTLAYELPAESLDRWAALGFEVREAAMRVRLATLASLGVMQGAGPTRLVRVREGEAWSVSIAGPVTTSAGEARVCVRGADGLWAEHLLDAGSAWTLPLGAWKAGRYVVRALHERSTVPHGELLVEVLAPGVPFALAVELGAEVVSRDALASRVFDLGAALAAGDVRVRVPAGATLWGAWHGVETVFLGALHASGEGGVSLAPWRARLVELAREDACADLCLDVGLAGELALAHEAPPDDARVLASLGALVMAAHEVFRDAVGSLGAWRSPWFAPVCRLLGYGLVVERNAPLRFDDVPEAIAWRLVSARRASIGQRSRVVPAGALVALPGGFLREPGALRVGHALAQSVCARWSVWRVLLTDGLRWAVYEDGRRRQRGVIDLGAVCAGDDHAAGVAMLDALAG